MGKNVKGKELGRGISQRSDGFYVGRFTSKGGQRKQRVFHGLQECRQWLAQSQYEDAHSDISTAGDITVDMWFDYWIAMKEKTVRSMTSKSYRNLYATNIKPIIGNTIISALKPAQCQLIMNEMADNGYKTTTVKQTRITLHNMLEYALQNDIITKNPCNRAVKGNIGVEPTIREALTLAQHRNFIDGIRGHRYEYQYKFVLQTGLRAGELIGLRWSNVDLRQKRLVVSQSMSYNRPTGEWVVGPPKSKSGYRTIPLTDDAIELLILQKEKNRSVPVTDMQWSDYVFTGEADGKPIRNDTYDSALYQLHRKIDIPKISMHILRHTFATRCIEAGMKPKTLQTILGHSNIGMTMNLYVHTTEDEKQKEIANIADALRAV